MGIAYRCVPELRCTFVVWDREVTPDEWRGHIDRLVADPAFPPGSLMVADLRAAGGAPSITTDVIGEIANRLNVETEKLGGIQIAVIPNGAWEKALQLLDRDLSIPGLRAIVFAIASTAFTWLGLDARASEDILDDLRAELRRAATT